MDGVTLIFKKMAIFAENGYFTENGYFCRKWLFAENGSKSPKTVSMYSIDPS
jgi:hypothetical protein